MKGDFVARVISNARAAELVSDISLELPPEASGIDPRPGQFAHLSVGGLFLRRPISIAGFDGESLRVRMIVRNAGRGSGAIASLEPGESVRMLLPLGSPFPVEDLAERRGKSGGAKKIHLVAGGIGAAPLLFAADFIRALNEVRGGIFSVESFAGFRDEASSFGADEFGRAGACRLVIGGLVTDALEESLGRGAPDAVLACGPEPMLEALQGICSANGIAAYASLEARMGCGVGACLVCSRRARAGGGAGYRRVCRDGPSFDLSEVIFK
ncbi:MAG: hypothetical protein LBS75_07520 [Synergistaceae bacterium]|nr:hypothetical protein [Synergistaceae bacterium]